MLYARQWNIGNDNGLRKKDRPTGIWKKMLQKDHANTMDLPTTDNDWE